MTIMRITWDEDKNRPNLAKHKISFETARLVFEDPFHVSRLQRFVEGEERWQTMGFDRLGRGCPRDPYLSRRGR